MREERQGKRASSLVSLLLKAFIPSDQDSTLKISSNPNYFPKVPISIIIIRRFRAYEFGQETTIQS
jgi:hypothetical protein